MADTEEHRTAEAARQEANRLQDELRERGAEAAHTARETAREYAERARDEAYARGEHYRDYAADETNKVADALRRAAEDLSSGSPQEKLVAQLADGMANAAESLRGMSVADVARDTTDFARRHPAAFLGGAALLGFAAARFLKATAHGDSARHGEQSGGSYPPPARYGTTPAPAPAPTPSSPVATGPGGA